MQCIKLGNRKNFFLLLGIVSTLGAARHQPKTLAPKPRCNLTLTTGYVFKHDDHDFKKIFNNGIQNIITVDACYYFLDFCGVGSKVSYWSTKGQTFLENPTKLQEIPLTFYIRTLLTSASSLQPYISLGGGVIFMLEKNYLETVKESKGIGEVELGLNFLLGRHLNLTIAGRYLFPRETFNQKKADIGGFDLRAGIGCSY